jgi:polysaccharide biosynthesis transport protein
MEFKGQKFDFRAYLKIFKRRKWFFIIPLFLIFITFFSSAFFLPRVYEAKAIILIEEQKVVNPLLKNLAYSTTVAQRLHTLREEILAWPRLYSLVERLQLNKDISSPIELEKLIHNIRKNIKLGMKSGDIVLIGYEGQDRYETQKVVNTLCNILIERNLSIIGEDTASAIDFINAQLKVYKEKLDSSATELRKFKEIYGFDVIPTLQSVKINNSDGSQGFEEQSAGMAGPLVQLGAEIADLEADLVMATVDCTDEHPRVKDLKRRIAALKEKRDQYIRDAAERTGADMENYVDIASSMPRQQEELAKLSRDKAINERIYAMLLERLESAKITESLDNSENRTKFRIIEPARLPLSPIKPNKAKLNFLGLLLGGMVGFGVMYILELTDSSFKTADGLKEAFELPVLGTTSRILTHEDLDKKTAFRKKVIKIMIVLTIAIVAASIIFARLGMSFVGMMG